VNNPKTLPCFTPEQKDRAHILLAIRVAHMMGRKFEEGDWSYVYCRAKGIPETGWSNLNIDVTYENLGVEHKMLCYRSDATLAQAFGTTLMHPAATRSIRIPSLDTDPNDAMRDILTQYAELIRARRLKVEEQNTTGKPSDMRTGWLLWQESLRQFLYFEEPMIEPDPSLYKAEWVERQAGGGIRKGSKNLWIFEKSTGRKRYSVTTSAGAKIQPYFDVPPPDDPNVYLFTVIGEQLAIGRIRVWLTAGTAKELERLVGSLDPDAVSEAILRTIEKVSGEEKGKITVEETGVSVTLREDAYRALVESFPGVSDEHCFRLLLEQLQ
jgi:hypothetical protein